MAYRNWLPSAWFGEDDADRSPFLALRKQIDTLMEDFDKGLPTRAGGFAVRTNVSETDNEIRITAELPGIELDDIDVSITGNHVKVSGEKKSESEDKGEEDGRQFHRVERSAGAFQRVLTLPFDVDPKSVKAKTKDGVLTVTIPKPPEIAAKTEKIAVEKVD